jgi:predicted transcriptional regulator
MKKTKRTIIEQKLIALIKAHSKFITTSSILAFKLNCSDALIRTILRDLEKRKLISRKIHKEKMRTEKGHLFLRLRREISWRG